MGGRGMALTKTKHSGCGGKGIYKAPSKKIRDKHTDEPQDINKLKEMAQW